MFFLAHLVAALASILPLLVAIQKSRNGDFDFVYQRTIDYTSSMHLPDILGYFLQNQEDKSTSSSAPFVFDPVNVTITQQDTGHPVEFHVVTEHLGPEEGGNATEEIKSTQTHKLSFLVGRFRQVISSLRVRWNEMGIFRHVFLLFHGMVCIMDDLTDVSLAFHLNHYDFSLASPSRTSEALGNALLSVWNSLGIKTLTSSFILAILIKLSLAITYTASIGFAYYVYVLLHDLAKTREDLRRVQSIVKALETHKNSQQFNLNLQANRFENLLLEKETLQATSTQQLKEYRSENTTFQSENRSKQRQIDGAHAEIKSLHLEIDSAKSEAETQQRRADGWKQRAETAKTEQIEASRTIEVLQKQVELKQQLVNQNAVVLQNLKAEHSSERDSYNAHILQTEERIDKLEEQFHLVKNLKEQLQRELAEIDDDHSSELERLKSEHGVERDSYLAKVLASQEKIEEFKDHILQLEELHESIMVLQDHQEELQEKRSGTNDNDDNERNSHDAEILAAQERIEQLEKDLAAKGGSRRKRKRGGQDRAGSRTIIKRRNSFDTHTPVPCSACRGPRRVKVASNAKSWKPYSDEHKMDESSEVAIAESESLEAPPTTDNYDSV
ncbi:MAG: hypothetical protein M1830_004135, partial [Pleopsidium flavum]